MPCRIPVGEILQPPELEAPRTISLYDYGSNGSLWVHPSGVINIPTRSSASNIITTLQNPKGEVVPITVSPYVHLVGLEYCWLNSRVVLTHSVTPDGMRDSYRELFRSSSSDWQQDLSR